MHAHYAVYTYVANLSAIILIINLSPQGPHLLTSPGLHSVTTHTVIASEYRPGDGAEIENHKQGIAKAVDSVREKRQHRYQQQVSLRQGGKEMTSKEVRV